MASVKKRPAPSGRVVSMSEFEKITGTDRGTLRKWLSQGCPSESTGGSGEAVKVDVRAVWKWREDQVRNEERRKIRAPEGAPAGAGGAPMSLADRKLQSQIDLNVQKIALAAKEAAPIDIMRVSFVRAMSLVRQAVMPVPERITREMGGFPEEMVRHWRLDALAQIRGALVEGSKTMNDAFRLAADQYQPITAEEIADEAGEDE